MKYRAEVDGKTHSVVIDRAPNDELSVEVDGIPYTIDLHALRDEGRFSLIANNHSFDACVTRVDSTTYEVTLLGQRLSVNLEDEKRAVLAKIGGHKGGSGDVEVKAPMPGLVLLTNVQPGDTVKRGQSLIILEAMKMENDLAAPRDGTVKEVRAIKGKPVNQGDVLVVLQ